MTPKYLRGHPEYRDTAFFYQLAMVGAIVLLLWLGVFIKWGM
jgi:hypothetical protein